MWHDEDEHCSIFYSLSNIWNRLDILPQHHSREILLILVLGINDFCQLLSLKLISGQLNHATSDVGKLTSSSYTHILTSSSKTSGFCLTLEPAILAMADPLSYQPSPSGSNMSGSSPITRADNGDSLFAHSEGSME